MAFSYTIDSSISEVRGTKRRTSGTFTNADSSTGGDIDTGLEMCEKLILQHTGTAVVASAPVVNETLPVDGSAVTIVTVANASGIWIAEGY